MTLPEHQATAPAAPVTDLTERARAVVAAAAHAGTLTALELALAHLVWDLHHRVLALEAEDLERPRVAHLYEQNRLRHDTAEARTEELTSTVAILAERLDK